MSEEGAVIGLTLAGQEQLVKILQKMGSAARGQLAKDAVDEGAAVLVGKAQLNALSVFSDKQRGQLRNSIRSESRITETGAEAEIGPHVIYARIQEFGGIIRPIHARALHFIVDNRDVFVRSVTLKPHPYMDPAVAASVGKIARVMADSIRDNLIGEISNG